MNPEPSHSTTALAPNSVAFQSIRFSSQHLSLPSLPSHVSCFLRIIPERNKNQSLTTFVRDLSRRDEIASLTRPPVADGSPTRMRSTQLPAAMKSLLNQTCENHMADESPTRTRTLHAAPRPDRAHPPQRTNTASQPFQLRTHACVPGDEAQT